MSQRPRSAAAGERMGMAGRHKEGGVDHRHSGQARDEEGGQRGLFWTREGDEAQDPDPLEND